MSSLSYYNIKGEEVNKMSLLKSVKRKFRALLIFMGIAAMFTPGIVKCSGEVGQHGNSGHSSIVANR